MRGALLLVLSLAGCATAEDDLTGNFDFGRPRDTGAPAADSNSPDTTTTDTGTVVDTSAPPPEDSGTVDSTVPAPDTGTPPPADSGPAVDTAPPPVDTGTGGACMWCSSGSCPTPLSDYACLLNCLSDGYLDCVYDPAASMPCKCTL